MKVANLKDEIIRKNH